MTQLTLCDQTTEWAVVTEPEAGATTSAYPKVKDFY